ncbi:MAG: hypothetical protein QF864_07265 [SAR202 cluster bacterium]|nr:hypothetical protein [SAR202 cluster bacterium]
MKKLLAIIVLGLLLNNVGHSEECSLIDHKKFKDEFIKCINKEKKFYKLTREKSKYNLKHFECLNLCKLTIKSEFTIEELHNFCLLQCGMK